MKKRGKIRSLLESLFAIGINDFEPSYLWVTRFFFSCRRASSFSRRLSFGGTMGFSRVKL